MSQYPHITVGVLALQGAVSEHIRQIEQLGAKSKLVKNPQDLTACNGLILPGGESTTIGRLMRSNGLLHAIQTFAMEKKAIFGTCAGMVLLAKQLVNDSNTHLKLMDIIVQRNASGRQIASFNTELTIYGLNQPFPAVFIRAPYISQITANNVQILSEFNQYPVLVRQENLLACSFHPELTDDLRIMQLFLEMI